MESVSTKQRRIAHVAHKYREVTTLAHHMDIHWLWEAYRRVNRRGAPGVDWMSLGDYEKDLMGNLKDLLQRMKSGRYQAPPVRRAHIPKNEHETRPIGIPTVEDKIAQHAIVMLLEPIYEGDFHPWSYGFRRGRGPHQALGHLRSQCFEQRVGWILDVDLRRYFDTIDHTHLREILRLRVRDGVVLRLIDKWLKAGVMEHGQLSYQDEGTPQGGVISPLLSNVFLHTVLDDWYQQEWKRRLKGRSFLVRYADDFVIGLECEEEAEATLVALRQRFSQYGLEVNAEKTRLIRFKRPPKGKGGSGSKPGTFDFLGFTHYWDVSRKGNWVVKAKTSSKRFTRSLKKLVEWIRRNRHLPLVQQHRQINVKLRGHDAYYGIPGNYESLGKLRYEVRRVWRKWLMRRSRGRSLSWEKFAAMTKDYPLVAPKINSTSQRNRHTEEPDASIALVRVCGGAVG
jgi:RNA-directed DNA polymerase